MSLFKILKKNHNGINFTMYQGINDSRAEAATQLGKFHLTGKPSITEALNQYKYGDEVIIQIYNTPGSVIKKTRVNEKWDRLQVFFKRDVFIEICKQFLKDISSSEIVEVKKELKELEPEQISTFGVMAKFSKNDWEKLREKFHPKE